MYIIENNTIVPVTPLRVCLTGEIVDQRLLKIERVVADYYNTTIHELDVFYKDSKPKIMCCFLLVHLLNYGVPGVAIKYNIDRFFLRKNIKAYYIKSLNNQKFMLEINILKDRILNKDVQPLVEPKT
jgi:hypothetical protein